MGDAVQDDCAHGHLAVVGFPAGFRRDDFGQQCYIPAGVAAAGAGLAAAAVLAGLFHPQGFQSGRASHAVCGQAVFLLEGTHGFGGLAAVHAVHGAVKVAPPFQFGLDGGHGTARVPLSIAGRQGGLGEAQDQGVQK